MAPKASTYDDKFRLYRRAADLVCATFLDTSLRVGVDALRLVGVRAHHAHRAAQRFRKADDAALRETWEETGLRVEPRRVFGVYAGLFRHVPFFPASGNHDYKTDGGAPSPPRRPASAASSCDDSASSARNCSGVCVN